MSDVLVAAFISEAGHDQIELSYSDNGSNWGIGPIPQDSAAPVGLAAFNDFLWVAFRTPAVPVCEFVVELEERPHRQSMHPFALLSWHPATLWPPPCLAREQSTSLMPSAHIQSPEDVLVGSDEKW
jgi:hypothetical protein